MRAGLSTIQQTLTPEAANVLSHSIAEAGRRNHSQTTPLHVASTLLASPSGFLRQACIKSHPNSSHPLQCRALELCFSVALERLPTAQGASPGLEPPISNALMAALKRAQAHQRRGCPEQQQQPLLAVKVELEQLIISILDDPSVSRVMREASFSSPAVKATIEQSLNSAAPATAGTNSSPIGLGFRSPAVPTAAPTRNLYLNPRLQQQQQQQQLGNSTQQRGEEVKRVIDILLRPKKRNPVLVGESEPEAVVKELLKRIENKELGDGLLKNIQVVPLDKEIGSDEAKIPTKFQELGDVLETKMGSSGGGGVVLDLGDLKWLVEQPAAVYGLSTIQPPQQFVSDKGRIMVAEVGKLLARFEKSSCRLWLIGTATCETYLRCQVYHPLMENDWDLQAVPIAARSPLPGLFPRLGADGILGISVESFSPLRNLPTTISPSPRLLPENLDPARRMGCCPECTKKCEQEIARAASTELEKPSPEVESESGRSPLPQWLQNAKVHGSQNKFKTKDQGFLPQKQRSHEIQKNGSLRSPHRHQNHPYLPCRRQPPMELPMLLTFVQTLIEAHKLFLRNGRLMVSIAASTVLLYSLLLLTNIFSLRPAVGQLIANTSLLLITSPTSTEYSYLLLSIQKDIRLFYGLEWVFVLLYSVCSILFSTVTIYASAASHGGKNLSAKDLGVAVARSWRRPFVTFFYITLFGVGYLILVLALTIPLVLPQAKIATVILCIVAALLYAHLAVVWTLGLVVSVLEEDKSGLEALAKAGQLVKGRQVHGFALSLVIVALSILMSQVMRLVSVPQSEGAYIAIGLVMLNSLWAARMFGLMAYTVFYYECKKFHGEESNELMVSLEYSKIPANTPLITENLP